MKKKILFLSLILFLIPFVKVRALDINYHVHVQDYGWLNIMSNDEMAGTTGQSKRMEAIKIDLSDNAYFKDISYQVHVQDYGWLNYVNAQELAGTTGQSKRLEAIRIKIKGELAEKYDIYYQVHVEGYGWLDYVSNDELAGTTGQSLRLEAIRIKLVEKNAEPQNKIKINYSSSVQESGFQDYITEGVSGTTGQSKYIDRIKIKMIDNNLSGDVQYASYDSTNGWGEYVNGDEISGTEKIPLEAIKIKLTDELESKYDIFYRVHVAEIGWMGWTKNDNPAGTVGTHRNMEAIEIVFAPKNTSSIHVSQETAFIEEDTKIEYSSHVSCIGWQDYVSSGISGTEGQSLRLEAIKIRLNSKIDGNIKYQTYIAKRGWSDEVKNDTISGTTGISRNLEAIKISLEGDIANYYDIYYKTHNSYIGWLSWTKNGEVSGSLNNNTQIEAIEIVLVKKGTAFKEDMSMPLVTGHWENDVYYDCWGNRVTGFRFIDGTKYYFNQEGILYGRDVMKAVDVSSWQQNINWDLIKMNEDVDKAIIRVGWGTSYDDECGLDSQYDYNIQNLQRLGIPYDVYIYGYAETEHAANKEADFVLYNLQRYNVPKDTFIWYDAELDIPYDTYRYVIPIFVNRIKAAGYKNVGVYSSVVRLDTSWGNLNDATIRSYPIWVAQYYRKNQYDGEYKVWQFQSDGQVDGINEYVDVNMYKK